MAPSVEAFSEMPAEQQRSVHLCLLERALTVWEFHYPLGGRTTYKESVAGSLQELDVGLPREALSAVKSRRDTANIAARYLEPIASLQDGDLAPPKPAEFAYYALYNGFRLHVIGQNIDPWLVVNQALSTVEPEYVRAVFQEAVRNGG